MKPLNYINRLTDKDTRAGDKNVALPAFTLVIIFTNWSTHTVISTPDTQERDI